MLILHTRIFRLLSTLDRMIYSDQCSARSAAGQEMFQDQFGRSSEIAKNYRGKDQWRVGAVLRVVC